MQYLNFRLKPYALVPSYSLALKFSTFDFGASPNFRVPIFIFGKHYFDVDFLKDSVFYFDKHLVNYCLWVANLISFIKLIYNW